MPTSMSVVSKLRKVGEQPSEELANSTFMKSDNNTLWMEEGRKDKFE